MKYRGVTAIQVQAKTGIHNRTLSDYLNPKYGPDGKMLGPHKITSRNARRLAEYLEAPFDLIRDNDIRRGDQASQARSPRSTDRGRTSGTGS